MKGMISIHQHRVSCLIGITAKEIIHPQDILIDIQVQTDFSAAIESNQIKDTVDYVLLANKCTRIAQEKHHPLLETLAWEILKQVMEDPRILWGSILIKKPAAIPSAHYTSVQLEQTRSN